MIYKVTITLSLLLLTVASSAQSDGGPYSSGQPQPIPPSATQTVTSQDCPPPSGSPISIHPTPSDGVFSRANNHTTGLSDCHPAIPTGTAGYQPLSSGVFPSGASPVSAPYYTATISDCESYTIPSGGALPTASGSAYPVPQNGSQPGNYSPPTVTSPPFSSGAVPPSSTSTYVGRRMLFRRQV